MDWFGINPFSEDFLGGIFLGLELSDFAIFFGVLQWLALLAVPLRKVDCRDPFAAAIYVAFCCASGIVLTIIIPRSYHNRDSYENVLLATIAFSAVSALRWGGQYISQRKASLHHQQTIEAKAKRN